MTRRLLRDLRLFYAFRLLATSYLFVPVFMLFQDERGLSYFEQLALGGIYSATIVLVEVPTGVFADRFGRRRSMLLGALTTMVACVLAARATSFAAFAFAESLAALALALCSGADSAYLFNLLAAHDRVAEYPRRESAASAWHLMGSALAFAGGGLVARVDLALPYLVTAGVAGLAAAVACFMRDDGPSIIAPSTARSAGRPRDLREIVPPSTARSAGRPRDLREIIAPSTARSAGRPRDLREIVPPSTARSAGRPRDLRSIGDHVAHLVTPSWIRHTIGALAEVARNGRLAWMVGYSAVVFALLRATIYVYQPYLAARGLGTAEIGVLFAGVYVISSLVAYRTYQLRARFGDELLLWGVLGVLAISFVGLAGAGNGPWMLGLLVVQAVANGIYSPLTKPLLNREIADSRRRAATLSVESMARRAAMGVFAPLVGLYGKADVMLLCGGVGLAGFVVLALARYRMAARSRAERLGESRARDAGLAPTAPG